MHTVKRLQSLDTWLRNQAGLDNFKLAPLAGDASFRRYFRITCNPDSFVLMDAPPEREDCHPFVNITQLLASARINVPELHHMDLEQGFLLLSDFGDDLYLDHLSDNRVDSLYQDAIQTLLNIQNIDASSLPAYDHALLLQEMNLFRHWFLERQQGIQLNDEMNHTMDRVFEKLAQSALSQPQVFVHRDYHSRNLLVTASNNPGILDYQDAVRGPVTYDLVSLLRDCYISWSNTRVEGWALDYLDLATEQGLLRDVKKSVFLKWFDLMGIQRHLKAIGIFARLNERDSKPGYLKDIPRTLSYVINISARHAETQELHELIVTRLPSDLINP